jgi:hypothetical protein
MLMMKKILKIVIPLKDMWTIHHNGKRFNYQDDDDLFYYYKTSGGIFKNS